MGYWDGKRPPKENFATKEDIKKLEKDMEKVTKQTAPQTQNTANRMMGSVKKGIGDIAESLSHPESKRRMRIAQMPGKKPPIARTRIENPIAGRGAGIKKRRISNAPLD